MDEAKLVLDNSTGSTPPLPPGYNRLSLSPLLADLTTGQELSLVDPTPPEIQIHESVPDQPLVVGSVELAPSVVHQVFSVESGFHPPIFFWFLQILWTWRKILLSLYLKKFLLHLP